ncbi:hypothetical protein MTYM_01983 [Methylococcales bacterium]|nr:hypothetical protein MTYM_01983 [Methylococcales bacterium]
MSIREDLEKLKDGLLQQRDELQLKAGLAKLEVRDEWETVEAKVGDWVAKLEELGGEASEASEDVLESAKHLGEEIKVAYEKIKAKL